MDHQSALERNLTERYILGELNAEEAEEFEEHFFDCEICAEDVREASRAAANMKVVLREDSKVFTVELALRSAPAAGVPIRCEVLSESGASLASITEMPANGWLSMNLPSQILAAGRCTLVLRDSESNEELERRTLLLSTRAQG